MSENRLDSAENQAARIFVANISPNLDPDDLKERFNSYGNIKAVVVLKGFGFVQFEKEEEAHNAIKGENGTEFKGRRLDVKIAKRREEAPSDQQKEQPQQQQQHQEKSNSTEGQLGQWQPVDRGGDRYSGGHRGVKEAGGSYRGRGGQRTGMPYKNPRQSRQQQAFASDYGRNDYEEQNYGAAGIMGAPSHVLPPAEELRNDCEIVCVNKSTRQYAELIEARLKNLGLRVDVLFPNPDIPLLKIIENIASRGVIYAILVTPINEQHRSLTLNVLQGQPQEHRNMPLEDAMSFVAKTFEAIMDGKMLNSAESNVLPNDIQTVLGFVADNRPLSVMEYDKLIRFFCMRRESVLRSEYGENIPPSLATPPVGPPVEPSIKAKQDELYERIISILNRPTQAVKGASSGQPELNPSLQRAIDSLIKTGPNLLNQMHQMPKSSSSGYMGYSGY